MRVKEGTKEIRNEIRKEKTKWRQEGRSLWITEGRKECVCVCIIYVHSYYIHLHMPIIQWVRDEAMNGHHINSQ
jgi:hypothetical protein